MLSVVVGFLVVRPCFIARGAVDNLYLVLKLEYFIQCSNLALQLIKSYVVVYAELACKSF